MLSDLIAMAQEVLAAAGDMPVGVASIHHTRDDSVPLGQPAGHVGAERPAWLRDYWQDQFNQAFVIDGR